MRQARYMIEMRKMRLTCQRKEQKAGEKGYNQKRVIKLWINYGCIDVKMPTFEIPGWGTPTAPYPTPKGQQKHLTPAESLGVGVGTGAKSLDHDLGDVHTWPHSYYLMRQYDGVGGWGKCG